MHKITYLKNKKDEYILRNDFSNEEKSEILRWIQRQFQNVIEVDGNRQVSTDFASRHYLNLTKRFHVNIYVP